MKKLLLLLTFSLLTSITYTMNDAAAADEPAKTIDDTLTELRNLPAGTNNWEKRKELIIQLIKKDPCTVDIEGCENRPPIHESIAFLDVAFAEYLLQHKADPNKVMYGQYLLITPLYSHITWMKCPFLSPEIVKKQKKLLNRLIVYGANPDQEVACSDYPETTTPRREATVDIRQLIEKAEKEKIAREYLLLITTYIPKEPAKIVSGYLDQDFHVTQT